MKVRFEVSGDLLADSLHLPPRALITDIVPRGQNFIFTVAISNDGDDSIIDVEPTVTKQEVTWNWNLPGEAEGPTKEKA